ncbi:MAG: GTP-binding protein [Draconibacterium sp.]|nr:GTP-binding protein [Draconibacterium sp.]
MRTTGAGFTKYFNIQNRRFTAVSCSQCGYTELYKSTRASGGSNVLDFLTN